MPEANRKAAASAKNGSKSEVTSQSPEKDWSLAESKKRTSKSPSRTEEDSPEAGSKKRRKVNHACLYCRRSHMTCDEQRPCTRCVKRNIGHLCHDEPREPAKKQKGEEDADQNTNNISPLQPQSNPMYTSPGVGQIPAPFAQPRIADSNQLQQQKPVGPQQRFSNDVFGYDDWNLGFQNQLYDVHSTNPYFMSNTSEVSNEYNLLSDFLNNSLLDDGAFYTDDDPTLYPEPSLSNTLGQPSQSQLTGPAGQAVNQALIPSPTAVGNTISRPASRAQFDKAREKAREAYVMAAADPDGTDAPEARMNRLLKAKYDAGLLKPFNYVKGYARLNQYIEKYFHANSRQRIAKQMDEFRPKFRERMQKLSDMELVLVEMWFEGALMEYDRVAAAMPQASCCWRRTGEIFRGTRDMAELIQVPVEQLRDGKLAIHDIIAEDSLVSYWEKFGAIAFDASQKGILTSCSLKNPNQTTKGPELKVGFSFTIKRDIHQIPSLIIGNFIPIYPRKATTS